MSGAMPSAEAARDLVDGLASAGLSHVCITPGSRSTPLTVAFARHSKIKAWLHLDERSSSYFALGLARALNAPVALVCTSGTAAANYWPAVAEANLSRIPLVVLTADRPPRLRDVGAEQTIGQVGMFGSNVRLSQDLPVPTGGPGESAVLTSWAGRSLRAAMGPLPGPVHLNAPYEEPLIDSADSKESGDVGALVGRAPQIPAAADIEAAAAVIHGRRRPLIVAGPESGGLEPGPLLALADQLDAPVVADPLSGIRTGKHDRTRVMDAADALARDPRAIGSAPDVVIRFGGVPTSKPLNQFLAAIEGASHVLCDLPGSWRDPLALADVVVSGDASIASVMLSERLTGFDTEPAWFSDWMRRNDAARKTIQAAALEFTEPFEGRVFIELEEAVPDGATIFAGSSMPVRDMDAFLAKSAKSLSLVSNRGANGIDGVVSSALGTAAADRGPVFLVIGDLSFYHDLNGLWAAGRHRLDLTVVLVNNDGGGIFHYLPQASHSDVFEEWFGTPSGLDFAPVVGMYGGSYELAKDWDEFRRAIRAPSKGLRVIEFRTDRARNVEMHYEAWRRAAAAAWDDAGGS